MKIKLTDFDDNYCLVIEADPHDPKVAEAAKELNSFWGGDDIRLDTAAITLEVEEKSPQALLGAAAITICSAAITAAMDDGALDVERLRHWFARGQEGYPPDFAEYGINLVSWSISLPDTSDVCLEEIVE